MTVFKLKGGVLDPTRSADDAAAARALRAAARSCGSTRTPPGRSRPRSAWPSGCATRTSSTSRTRRPGSRAWPRWPATRRSRSAPTCASPPSTTSRPPSAQRAVQVVLGDHHGWGGLTAFRHLGAVCKTLYWGLSQHSNSHLGISFAAMIHAGAAIPRLTYASDTHYPWNPARRGPRDRPLPLPRRGDRDLGRAGPGRQPRRGQTRRRRGRPTSSAGRAWSATTSAPCGSATRTGCR